MSDVTSGTTFVMLPGGDLNIDLALWSESCSLVQISNGQLYLDRLTQHFVASHRYSDEALSSLKDSVEQ